MDTSTHHEETKTRPGLVTTGVVMVSLLVIGALFSEYQSRAAAQQAEEEQSRAEALVALEVARLGDGLELLATGFADEVEPDIDDFERAARAMMRTQPGARKLRWVPHVRGADRQTYSEAAQADEPGFRIWQNDEAGEPVSATMRFHYFPERWAWPAPSNGVPLGFDMGVNESVRTALLDAMVAGDALALGSDYAEDRLVIVQPVYVGGVPDDEGERRAKLRGFLIGEYHRGAFEPVASL